MKRIKELELLITKARNDYYNNQPTVTDQAFDAWIDELKLLDPDNKAVTSVGALPVSEWKKCKHQITMGSLDKVNTIEELKKWYDGQSILIITEKLDGLSINCEYENGYLVRALTRGNGDVGEDILSNVVKMEGVKKYINGFTGSLRGEIILKKSNYNKYFSDKANTRNAASGISKRLDGVGSEHLTIIFYKVVGEADFENIKESKCLSWLTCNGMLIPNSLITSNIDAAIDFYNKYQNGFRDTLDYDIDGLVVGYDDIDYSQSLGEIHRRPKGVRAFKFDHKCVEATLLDVIWQVGNSGRVTPIAILSPVVCAGVEIKKASLHNVKTLQKLQLFKGCKVLVSRRNDVIPYVERKIDYE